MVKRSEGALEQETIGAQLSDGVLKAIPVMVAGHKVYWNAQCRKNEPRLQKIARIVLGAVKKYRPDAPGTAELAIDDVARHNDELRRAACSGERVHQAHE